MPSNTFSKSSALLSILSTALLLAPAAATELDCKHIVKDKKEFDLSKLSGKHSVHYVRSDLPGQPGMHNTTFTTDLCHPLKDSGCPQGTRSGLSPRSPRSSSELTP